MSQAKQIQRKRLRTVSNRTVAEQSNGQEVHSSTSTAGDSDPVSGRPEVKVIKLYSYSCSPEVILEQDNNVSEKEPNLRTPVVEAVTSPVTTKGDMFASTIRELLQAPSYINKSADILQKNAQERDNNICEALTKSDTSSAENARRLIQTSTRQKKLIAPIVSSSHVVTENSAVVCCPSDTLTSFNKSSQSPSTVTQKDQLLQKKEHVLECKNCRVKYFGTKAIVNHLAHEINLQNICLTTMNNYVRAFDCEYLCQQLKRLQVSYEVVECVCNGIFLSRNEFNNHKRGGCQSELKCPFENCSKSFSTCTNWNLHVKEYHGLSSRVRKQLYGCSYCGGLFESKLQLQEHISSVCYLKDIVCCNVKFTIEEDYILHLRLGHEMKYVPQPVYHCNNNSCDYVCCTQRYLQRHMDTCHPSVFYQCNYDRKDMVIGCDTIFKTEAEWYSHLDRHVSLRYCTVCQAELFHKCFWNKPKLIHRHPQSRLACLSATSICKKWEQTGVETAKETVFDSICSEQSVMTASTNLHQQQSGEKRAAKTKTDESINKNNTTPLVNNQITVYVIESSKEETLNIQNNIIDNTVARPFGNDISNKTISNKVTMDLPEVSLDIEIQRQKGCSSVSASKEERVNPQTVLACPSTSFNKIVEQTELEMVQKTLSNKSNSVQSVTNASQNLHTQQSDAKRAATKMTVKNINNEITPAIDDQITIYVIESSKEDILNVQNNINDNTVVGPLCNDISNKKIRNKVTMDLQEMSLDMENNRLEDSNTVSAVQEDHVNPKTRSAGPTTTGFDNIVEQETVQETISVKSNSTQSVTDASTKLHKQQTGAKRASKNKKDKNINGNRTPSAIDNQVTQDVVEIQKGETQNIPNNKSDNTIAEPLCNEINNKKIGNNVDMNLLEMSEMGEVEFKEIHRLVPSYKRTWISSPSYVCTVDNCKNVSESEAEHQNHHLDKHKSANRSYSCLNMDMMAQRSDIMYVPFPSLFYCNVKGCNVLRVVPTSFNPFPQELESHSEQHDSAFVTTKNQTEKSCNSYLVCTICDLKLRTFSHYALHGNVCRISHKTNRLREFLFKQLSTSCGTAICPICGAGPFDQMDFEQHFLKEHKLVRVYEYWRCCIGDSVIHVFFYPFNKGKYCNCSIHQVPVTTTFASAVDQVNVCNTSPETVEVLKKQTETVVEIRVPRCGPGSKSAKAKVDSAENDSNNAVSSAGLNSAENESVKIYVIPPSTRNPSGTADAIVVDAESIEMCMDTSSPPSTAGNSFNDNITVKDEPIDIDMQTSTVTSSTGHSCNAIGSIAVNAKTVEISMVTSSIVSSTRHPSSTTDRISVKAEPVESCMTPAIPSSTNNMVPGPTNRSSATSDNYTSSFSCLNSTVFKEELLVNDDTDGDYFVQIYKVCDDGDVKEEPGY